MDTEATVHDEKALKVPEQLVTFELGSEEYGFDILDVREIVRESRLTRIPLAPKHVKGVTNLRGDILPVIDLRTKFGITGAQQSDKSRILVVDHGNHQTGLIVDSVHEVTRVESDKLAEAPENLNTNRGKYLRNLLRLGNGERIIMNLDPEKVCEYRIDQSLFDREAKGDNSSLPSSSLKAEESILCLVFVTDGIEYTLPIETVKEVIRIREPRRPSQAPEFIVGVLSLRDQVLPIIDMRQIFGRPKIEVQRQKELTHLRLETSTLLDELSNGSDTADARKTSIKRLREIASKFHSLRSADDRLNNAYDQLRLELHDLVKLAETKSRSVFLEGLELGHKRLEKVFDQTLLAIKTGAKQDQRIIVTRDKGLEYGLIVDSVKEVLPLPKSCIEDPPAISKKKSKHVAGVAKLSKENRMILIVDPEAIIPEGEHAKLKKTTNAATETTETIETQMNPDTQQSVFEEELQIVCFKIGEDEFGAPIQSIREIDRVSRITPIPEAPDYVDGISNLRGEVLTIVNLRKRFLLEEKASDDKCRVIVAEVEGHKTGLLVDSVSHVLRIPKSVMSGAPKETSGSPLSEFISGIAKAENGRRIIIVVDIESLLKSTELELSEN